MDGSGRLTKRNRRFLRPIKAYKDIITEPVHGRPVSEADGVGEVVSEVTDTTGFTSLLPEAGASRPVETVTGEPSEGVLEFPVQMADEDFDEGLLRAAANVQRQDEVTNGDVVPEEAGRRLRRSSRNVQRPASYGR